MKFVVWGCEKNGQLIAKWGGKKEGYECVGFIDSNHEKWNQEKGGIPVYSIYHLVDLYKDKEKIKVVVPLTFSEDSVFSITRLLAESFGFELEDICYCPSWLINEPQLFEKNIDLIFTPCMKSRELLGFSYVTGNDCNLTCKACTTCSPLVEGEDRVTFDSFKKDVDRLRELFDNIKVVSFQGGECLLDESTLCEFIDYYAQIFPKSEIRIRTNATLIPTLKESTFNCFVKNNVIVEISLYGVVCPRIDKIIGCLQKWNLRSTISYVEKFTKRISIEPMHDLEKKSEECRQCMRFNCVQLQDGKMCRCPFPRAMTIFNKEFNLNMPTDGEIDIHDKTITTEILYKKLLAPVGFCRYCHMEEHAYDFPHEMLKKKDRRLEDWISKEK